MSDRKKDILSLLSKHKAEIAQKYEVKSLAVFGSFAQETATADSDLDILVEYSNTPGLFEFLNLKNYLEELTGHRVDLVTRNALKKQMRRRILDEAVYVP